LQRPYACHAWLSSPADAAATRLDPNKALGTPSPVAVVMIAPDSIAAANTTPG